MSNNALNIGILDDHALFRKGLLSVLQVQKFVDKIYDSSSVSETLKRLRQRQINVLFLDLEMPGIDGFEFLDIVKRHELNHQLKIIVMSVREDRVAIQSCFRKGIDGYIPKNTNLIEIRRLLARLIDDDYYYSLEARKLLFNEANKLPDEKLQEIGRIPSKMELKVLILNCFQFSLKEMAEKLYVSEGTIKSHRSHLYKKVKVKNSVGLAMYALRQGYLNMNDLGENPDKIMERYL